MQQPSLILASASPRRQELLTQLGLSFQVSPQDIDETQLPDENPQAFVQRMADEKAASGYASLSGVPGAIVIASDTEVICDGQVFGKPRDKSDGVRMLMTLQNRQHQVLTAVTLISDTRRSSALVSSSIMFGAVSEDQAASYWETGEPEGKAGGYAVQGLGAMFVKSIKGSYSAVVGLPLYETAQLLRDFGVDCVRPERRLNT